MTLADNHQPSFYDRRDYPSQFIDCVTAGDVNGDGISDLIGGNAVKGINVQFGNGDGSFRPGPTSVPNAVGPQAMVAIDLNGDGKLDLVMATDSEISPSPYGIAVSLGNGDGTFTPSVFYQAGTGSFWVHLTVGDFDGDQISDAAILSPSGVWFYHGHSDGTFSSPALKYILDETSTSSYKLASADVNGDGHLDLVVLTGSGYAVLLGNGKGVFSAKSYKTPAPPFDIAIGDLSSDGHPDLVLVSPAFPSGGDYAYVLLGNGEGKFGSASWTYLPGQKTVRLGDINKDGHLDLVSGFGYVAFGKGDGKFQKPTFFPIAAPLNTFLGAFDITLADLLGRGSLDIVTANQREPHCSPKPR